MTTPIEDAIELTEKFISECVDCIHNAPTSEESNETRDHLATARTVLDALRFKQEAEKQEPVAWLFQHGETGLTQSVALDEVDRFEVINQRWQRIGKLYLRPQPIAPDRPEVLAKLRAGEELRNALRKLIDKSDDMTVHLLKVHGELVTEDFAVASNNAIDALAKYDATKG